MADNTVIKTIENVDQLFPEIVVNGESHVSDRYVPPTLQPQQTVPVEEEETPQEETPAQVIHGEDVNAVELNNVIHNFVDENEVTARQNADTQIQNSINAIRSLIPNQASSENQLADKNFVNSSIATNTANFIGTFESVTNLRAYAGTVTDNDYAFVVNEVIQYNGGDFPDVTTLNNYDKTALTNGDYAWVVNAEDNTKYDLYRFDIVEQTWDLRNTKIDKSADVLNSFYNRYKATVSGSTVTWLYEYTLNNSSFTAEQWATINSGLTQQSVDEDIQEALADVGADIDVYPTEQDLDSDLSNLDDGQFVATEEGTLFSTTDEVEVGNSHPVTSNAVAVSKSYSTTEQLTGGYWIDGKPIYRICGYATGSVTLNGLATATVPISWFTTTTKPNIDKIIKFESAQNDIGLVAMWRSPVQNSTGINCKNISSDGYGFSSTTLVVIEYTKST